MGTASSRVERIQEPGEPCRFRNHNDGTDDHDTSPLGGEPSPARSVTEQQAPVTAAAGAEVHVVVFHHPAPLRGLNWRFDGGYKKPRDGRRIT